MKPYLICHMIASVGGRTLLRRWRPVDESRGPLFERLHERLGSDAWLVGRVTGQEYAKLDAYPRHTEQVYPREPWFARRDAAAYGVVLDARGKIAWGRADIGRDPIVVVLTETVSDAHLAGLRKDGVSYIFAGERERELDLGRALAILNEELGIKRLELNGGGVTNGSFLRAGLIDEVSLPIFPAVDGAKGAPCVFDSRDAGAGTAARSARWRSQAARCWRAGRYGCATGSRTGERAAHSSRVLIEADMGTTSAATGNVEASETSDFDAIIIGAGVSGLYQLYKLRELGLRVRVLEAGGGIGRHLVFEPVSRRPV
ncbi:MAG: dihydrofolate reductase family protein [Acetobacteraceae bacterium]|nr:dihydrofolate reductase family protein [Acetobacteraceae bacterium]